MELYRVYIDSTSNVTKTVTVNVNGVISDEQVTFEVSDPIIVGYYFVENVDDLVNNVLKGIDAFRYEKLPVHYSNISKLGNEITSIDHAEFIKNIQGKLTQDEFIILLNILYGKPLRGEPEATETPPTQPGDGIVIQPLPPSDTDKAIEEVRKKIVNELIQPIETPVLKIINDKLKVEATKTINSELLYQLKQFKFNEFIQKFKYTTGVSEIYLFYTSMVASYPEGSVPIEKQIEKQFTIVELPPEQPINIPKQVSLTEIAKQETPADQASKIYSGLI